MRADGAGEPQRLLETPYETDSFSPDGKRLAVSNPVGEPGIWTLPLDMADPDHPKPGIPELFSASKDPVNDAAFSPEGRWLAYTSRETLPSQVFVRPFSTTAGGSSGKWQISTDSGQYPLWLRSTRDLFYLRPDGPRA